METSIFAFGILSAVLMALGSFMFFFQKSPAIWIFFSGAVLAFLAIALYLQKNVWSDESKTATEVPVKSPTQESTSDPKHSLLYESFKTQKDSFTSILSDAVQPSDPEYRSSPTPEEIHDHAKSQPALKQHDEIEEYVGLKVAWTLKLFNIHVARDTAQVKLCPLGFGWGYPEVTFTTSLNEYPYLKLAKSEETITVYGTIQKASGWHVHLELKKLVFPDRSI